jgi:hypothetical protein
VKLNFIKIKNFCLASDAIERMRRQAADCEEFFANHLSEKETAS